MFSNFRLVGHQPIEESVRSILITKHNRVYYRIEGNVLSRCWYGKAYQDVLCITMLVKNTQHRRKDERRLEGTEKYM